MFLTIPFFSNMSSEKNVQDGFLPIRGFFFNHMNSLTFGYSDVFASYTLTALRSDQFNKCMLKAF